MARVQFITLDAGPAGVRQPGQIVDVPMEEAIDLVSGGYATAIDTVPMPPRAETGMLSGGETAARESSRGRGRGAR